MNGGSNFCTFLTVLVGLLKVCFTHVKTFGQKLYVIFGAPLFWFLTVQNFPLCFPGSVFLRFCPLVLQANKNLGFLPDFYLPCMVQFKAFLQDKSHKMQETYQFFSLHPNVGSLLVAIILHCPPMSLDCCFYILLRVYSCYLREGWSNRSHMAITRSRI